MHRMTCLIALTGILIEAHPLWAQTESKFTETADGITWTYTVNADDGGVTLTGADPASGQLTIPDTLGGRPVTAIGNSALSGKTELTHVTLPGTVTKILHYAFTRCSKLKRIDLPDSLVTIQSCVFKDCTSLEQIRLPVNLSELQSAAFWGCVKLQQIVIPDNITKINSFLLSGCTSLTTVVLPASLKTIYVTANDNNSHPFYHCPITTLIFRSSDVPALERASEYYYIHSYVKDLVCYTDTVSRDKWKSIMSGTGNYTLCNLTNGTAIPGTTLLEIITANPGKSLTINPLTSGAATTNGQPLSEGAVACFDGIMAQTTSWTAVTVTVTPYAFGISGIRAEANGDVIVTAEVTGISGDATRDDAVMFADGTDVVAVYHTTGADGSSLQKEAGRTYVKGELAVKDRVEILLKGFLAADGLAAAEGAHRLTVYATKPIANTAASGE